VRVELEIIRGSSGATDFHKYEGVTYSMAETLKALSKITYE
jgi:hypothetical protein